MKKRIFLLLLVAVSVALWSEYDERNVLRQQAQRAAAQRNYEQADEIYRDMLKRDPSDYQIVENFVRNLFAQQKLTEAQATLDQYASVLPPIVMQRLKLQLLLQQGKDDEAEKSVEEFLKTYPDRMNFYPALATVYQSYKRLDNAANLLLRARKYANNDHAYSYQLANIYFSAEKYPRAIAEYSDHLSQNKAYIHFVFNRFKTMLDADPSLIDVIFASRQTYGQPQNAEVIARCLAYAGRLDEALAMYQNLAPQQLLYFADEQFSAGNYTIALDAYRQYEARASELFRKADARLKQAEVLMKMEEYPAAKKALESIYNWKDIQKGNARNRTRANRLCRAHLAEIELRTTGDVAAAIQLLQEAVTFAYNGRQRQELQMQVVDYLILDKQFDRAQQELASLRNNDEPGSDTYNQSYFSGFLLSLYRQDGQTDSLLVDLLVHLPQDPRTNDALSLAIFSEALSDSLRPVFLDAYRQRQLFRHGPARDVLRRVAQQGGTEEVRILAVEWALEDNEPKEALELLNYEYADTTYADYAAVLRAELAKDKGAAVRDELTRRADSVFAPLLRRRLQ